MLNKAILMGRLTKDPAETRTNDGTTIGRFTLAIARKNNRDEVDYINIVAFKKTAEFCLKWFRKGQAVYVVGPIQTRKWTANNNEVRYVTEVIADEVGFGENKKRDNEPEEMETGKQTLDELVEDDDLPF